MAELIKMLFGMWIQVGSRNHVVDGVTIPTQESAILTAKQGRPRTCLTFDILKATQQGQNWFDPHAKWRVLDGVHIGTTW